MRNTDPFSDLIRSIEENLQRDGDWIPPEQGPRRVPEGNPRRWLWLLVPLLLFVSFNVVIGFLTDWAWYASLGFSSLLFTRLAAAWALFIVGFLLCWLFLAINVLIARRLEPLGVIGTPLEQIATAFGVRVHTVVLAAGAVFAFFMALGVAADWQQLLLYLNQTSFAVSDPLFGRNVSFFMFTLPVWEIVRGWLLLVVLGTLVAVGVVSGVGWRGWNVRSRVLLHLAVLGALALALVAWQYRIDALKLVYSERGAVLGAGYTDVHAQLPAYNLLTIVTLVTAAVLVVTALMRRAWRAIVVVLLVWVAVAVVAGIVYPGFVQRLQVDPNELTLERPYIEDNIRYTRLAYGLDEVEAVTYSGASRRLTPEALLSQPETVRNIRLWDYRPLLQTYNQVQALRQYYAFNDVDVDRYDVAGRRQQVMISARELVPDRLSAEAQTWVNRKLVYTHGYGVAMSPVALVTADGLPEFFIKDLPPTGAISVTLPQIYFGELTDDYVVGNTKSPEFDYPQGGGYATTQFSAKTGIEMSFWMRLLFAIRYADVNVLLSQDITPESQLLWRRNIVERVELLAPFLHYDTDPYIVVGDGRLYWLIDAYTTSDRYPYSEQFAGSLNYIRNPVKVVIDAYDGTTTFYLVDDTEPIAATYARIFPTLFKPLSAMPPYLLDHLRYPTDLFSVQADLYRTYHMTNPSEFYNREDLWAWPQEMLYNELQRIEPYYVLMQLPGSEDLDYVQILPFAPANRENMIAWMAAQSDPGKYGEKIVYEFGKDTLFFGPQQIEARIDQDPAISAQLSLWNQQGSSVLRGNLLVIPIGTSLLYVEPLYLQAENGKIPELKRVVLATADQVVMAENLGLALARLFGRDLVAEAGLEDLLTAPTSGQPELPAPGAQAGKPLATPAATIDLSAAGIDELIVAANDHYRVHKTICAPATGLATAPRWTRYRLPCGAWSN